MLNKASFKSFLVVVAAAALLPSSQAEFEAIDGAPQDFVNINTLISCATGSDLPSGGSTSFSIEPTSDKEVVILMDPPNFLNVKVIPYKLGGFIDASPTLMFEYNETIAFTKPPFEASGVRILVPFDKLVNVEVAGKHSAQIVEGFTNVKTIIARYYANLDASLVNSSLTGIFIQEYANATIIGNPNVGAEISVVDNSFLYFKGNALNFDKDFYMRIQDHSQAHIDGNITLDEEEGLFPGLVRNQSKVLTSSVQSTSPNKGCRAVTTQVNSTCEHDDELNITSEQPLDLTSPYTIPTCSGSGATLVTLLLLPVVLAGSSFFVVNW